MRIRTFMVIVVATWLSADPVMADTNCTFTFVGTKMVLDGDCFTDQTILVPDGFVLDGNNHTITAVDPTSGHFLGAVVKNEGTTAAVMNLRITTLGLKNVCDAGDNRLRGILFEGASGEIVNNTIIGINQGLSGCQEGNGIEVRNAPFDGTHPNTITVSISGNTIEHYQKTGIVANGDVEVGITNNYVGSADLDDYIAANSIQMGFGAMGAVNNNIVYGNDWDGPSDWVATAVLIYLADGVNVNHNQIYGVGTDVGVYAYSSGTINIMNNRIERDTDDNVKDPYGIGVYFWGNSGKSKLVRNRLSGWVLAQDGADLYKVNVILP